MRKIVIFPGENVESLMFLKEVAPDISPSRSHRKMLWRCKCGEEKEIRLNSVLMGLAKSCGCIQKETSRKNGLSNLKHGFSAGGETQRFYKIFRGIKQRTGNRNAKDFPRYGGRGIKCDWENFDQFLSDMYSSYMSHVEKFGEKNTTIERKDNNKNYCKENCIWDTMLNQSKNKRSSILIDGKTLMEIANMKGIPYQRAWKQYKNNTLSI